MNTPQFSLVLSCARGLGSVLLSSRAFVAMSSGAQTHRIHKAMTVLSSGRYHHHTDVQYDRVFSLMLPSLFSCWLTMSLHEP